MAPAGGTDHGGDDVTQARTRLAGLVAILVLASGGTACGPAGTARWAGGASPSAATARPVPPRVPFSYRLSSKPDSYEVRYDHVLITLREHPLLRLSFEVDPAHPDATARLVTQNKTTGDKEHWSMSPVAVDGGTGYRAEYPVGGETYLLYFFAKGPIAVSLKASLGAERDAAARADAEHIVTSLRFDASHLTGPYGDAQPAPAIPFTFDLPARLAAATYPAQRLDGYSLNLRYGAQKVLVNDEILADAPAAAAAFTDRRTRIVRAGATPHDVRTVPAVADSLGRLVDEGFSVHIDKDGQPYLVGFVFRHGNQLVTLSTTVEGVITPQTLQALQAPLDMAGSWSFTGT